LSYNLVYSSKKRRKNYDSNGYSCHGNPIFGEIRSKSNAGAVSKLDKNL
jgi:hypothetical protein